MRIRIDIDNMPLFKAVLGYGGRRFHMPGHKAGKLAERFFKNAARLDITELSFSDNLLNPKAVILQAEELCAKLYGARRVKYGTCGSTVNILSLINSLRHRGNKLIIQKNSHSSVYSALILSGIEPVILDGPQNEDGLPKFPPIEDFEQTLSQNPDCIGALVTSPDYLGFLADLKEIKAVLKDKLLLVDAAHGGHLPFLNKNAYASADAYVVSPHKTLLGLTPASFAAFNDDSLFEPFLESFRMFHSSSPSYPILSSLELSREVMEKNGERLMDELFAIIAGLKRRLDEIGYSCIENDDFSKLLIKPPKGSGYSLYKKLEGKGVFLELADPNYALALFSLADGKRQADSLYKALKEVLPLLEDGIEESSIPHLKTQRAMSYLEAENSEKERVPLDKAAGRVSAANAGLYPPACPLVTCGEVLTTEICGALSRNRERAFGVDLDCIYVVK